MDRYKETVSAPGRQCFSVPPSSPVCCYSSDVEPLNTQHTMDLWCFITLIMNRSLGEISEALTERPLRGWNIFPPWKLPEDGKVHPHVVGVVVLVEDERMCIKALLHTRIYRSVGGWEYMSSKCV